MCQRSACDSSNNLPLGQPVGFASFGHLEINSEPITKRCNSRATIEFCDKRRTSMDLDREQESRNIEDRRGHRVSRGVAGGGIGTIIIILLALFFGFDPRLLLQGNVEETNFPQGPMPQSQQPGINDEMREFVARVLGSTERTWD